MTAADEANRRPLHFSSLRNIGLSPAHYRHRLAHREDPDDYMSAGTVCALHVFGKGHSHSRQIAVYRGRRQGKTWEAFFDEHSAHEIVTESVWDQGRSMADAVLADPRAVDLLAGARYEVPLSWASGGRRCATGGVDWVGLNTFGDLKTTKCAMPRPFMADAFRRQYHAQLEWYRQGLDATMPGEREAYIIAVESSEPYPVVVYRMPPDVLELGARTIARWLETLQRCEENDHWPGYAERVVDFEAPAWATEVDDG